MIKNIENISSEIDTPAMMVKIKNWAEKFNYDYEIIKKKILDDEIFACVFVKDPRKQNIYEKTAAKYISSIEGISEFKKLPNSGKNALYINKGVLCHNKKGESKSIDFIWKFKDITFLASHKYTKDSGGGQDNQYNDIMHFLKNSRENQDYYFLAICDGPYYLEKIDIMNSEFPKKY